MQKHFIILLLLLLAVSCAAAPVTGERANYYGRSLPYPTYVPATFEWPTITPFSQEQILRLQLRVSTEGRVDSLVLPQALLGIPERFVSGLIDSSRFEPGLIDGKPSPFWIYAKLYVYGKRWLPTLVLPTDTLGGVAETDIFFESLELNGVSLPGLVDFPRFGCYFNSEDSLSAIPTSIVSVDIDGDGKVVDGSMLRGNALLPDAQLLSAILWAKFRPVRIEGQERAARVYITASCFPLQEKPVYPFEKIPDSLRDFFREYQVRLRYDTLGLLLPAIPRRARPSEIVVNASGRGPRNVFTMQLKIDTTGKATSPITSSQSEYHQNLVKTLLRDLRFHPAINWQGEPVVFSGLVRIDATNEPSIRIEYFW